MRKARYRTGAGWVARCAMAAALTCSVVCAQQSAGNRIAGTVLSGATGEPLARAVVSLLAEDNEQTLASTSTDAQGRFSFEGLAAAKYPLTASKRGFRSAFYDEHEGYNTAIVTGPDQDTTHLILFLVQGSVLHGVVTADGGDPVEGARMILFQKARTAGEADQLPEVDTTLTDDAGAYEFGSLADGDYLVAVAAQPWYAMHRAGGKKDLDVAYPVTYFDSTTEEGSATPIAIGKGAREQADIHLHAVPALRIAVEGVRRADGRVARPELQQIVFGQPIYAESVGFLDAITRGSTEFDGVAPGHYELTLNDPPRVVDMNATEDLQVGQNAGSLTESVTGTLRMSNGTVPLEEGHVTLHPEEGAASHTPVHGVIRNGQFHLDSVAPGTWSVVVESGGKTAAVLGVSTESATLPGDRFTVRDRPLNIAVTIGQGSSRIGGRVQKDGKGLGGAMVVLVPRAPGRMETLARRDQSDSDGSFSLRDVVPGQYTIVAIEDGWKLDWTEPGALARYLPQGQSVTLQDNPEGTVQLTAPVAAQPR
ncbi:MAG TPA: carboxypeptidase regulatory-like domain-containing protein [Terracidiphilus sp.]|nr:carboxypeptidase regulatory-like domain-containing protein [Terracidiphilus sp.]